MATKKQLINRWLDEPGRSIDLQMRQIMRYYVGALRLLAIEASEATGLYHIPKEKLPPFDTAVIFDLLKELPYRNEVPNGRDLRGMPWICGPEGWDFAGTDFSFLPSEAGHSFSCRLDGAVFDGSKGEFKFRYPLRNVRFRKVHFHSTRLKGVFFGCDCFECDFTGAKMKQAHFLENADLRGSSFAGADLTWALLHCDLRGCDFRGANLSCAYIQESKIDKTTDFRGANLVGLHWQDLRDKFGNLFKHGTDWRQGTYDGTTMHD